MKVHRVVQMIGLTQESGRLAKDMYELNDKMYRSESTNKEIPISHMDFQHMVRAFVKLCEQEEMLDRSKHMGRVVDVIKAKDSIINALRSEVETYKEKNEKLEGIIEEKDEIIDFNRKKFHYWHKAYNEVTDVKGCRYVFSEIPNDTEGQEFVDTCKKYLNKPSYKIRVKGQHLKKELYGQGKASYGVNLGDSTHMRVYIDKKIGDE